MFYQENQINEVTRCLYCKYKLNDPRFIECGTSLCIQCIELLTNKCANGFKCPICKDFHEKPKKGFPKIANLSKLCDMKPSEISRGPLADTLKAQLDEIKLKLDQLDKDNKLGADKIKEYYDELRNEVQLSSEELIESINKRNMELIVQINAYEKKSMLDFSKENKTQLDSFIQEMRGFHSKWDDYLRQIKLEYSDLKKVSNEASVRLEQIKKEEHQFLFKLFNGKLLRYEKNSAKIMPSVVGTLNLAKGDVNSNFRKRLSNEANEKVIQLPKFSTLTEPISVKLLNDDKILLAYRAYGKKDVRIKIVDCNNNQLCERMCTTARLCKTFQLNPMANNSIILCLSNFIDNDQNPYTYKSDDEDSSVRLGFLSSQSVIKQYDNKLKRLKTISLKYKVSSIDTFDNKIYCLSKDSYGLEMRWIIYNDELVNIMKIESDPIEPFYVPKDSNKVQVCESFYVYLENKEIVLLDRKTGWPKKRFKIESDDFLLNPSSNSILTYNNKSKQMVCFDFEGKQQTFDINIPNIGESAHLVDCLNEKLLFLDSKSDCLYIS